LESGKTLGRDLLKFKDLSLSFLILTESCDNSKARNIQILGIEVF